MLMRSAVHTEAPRQTQPNLFVVALVVLGGLCWGGWLWQTFRLPDVREWLYANPERTAYMAQSSTPPILTWADLEHISPHLQRAVVVGEDDKFFEHSGFDWAAIRHAVEVNWKKQRFALGASTITQQLARNLYLSADKNLLRKLMEAGIALRLEQELPKTRILELYLNVAEWGPGIFGAEAASQYYFRHSAKSLSRSEAAFLAGILPNPLSLGKRNSLGYRGRAILRRL